ncbi:hypothetical protein [Spirosoma litoris]
MIIFVIPTQEGSSETNNSIESPKDPSCVGMTEIANSLTLLTKETY